MPLDLTAHLDALARRPGGSPPPQALDLTAFTRELDPFARLVAFDARLEVAGFPPMSPWWRYDLERFYGSGKRWGVYLVGRGGGKSTTLTRVAACEGMFSPRQIPPGQRWVWPFISAGIADARRRIVEIAAILAALGVEVEPSYPQGQPTIETVDATGNPIAFAALAGTIASVSGPSTIGATVDEEAKLRDRDTHANPAREILASLVQTFRARPGVRGIRCSSAWTDDGTHAAAIHEGDTSTNHVGKIGTAFLADAVRGFVEVAAWEEARGDKGAAATVRAHAAKLTATSPNVPTWIANPTIGAVASRVEVDALPVAALGGLSRTSYWMRENASALPSPEDKAAAAAAEAAEKHRRVWAGFMEAQEVFSPTPFFDPRDLEPYPEDWFRRV